MTRTPPVIGLVLGLVLSSCSGPGGAPGVELVLEVRRGVLPATTEEVIIRPPFDRRSGPEGAETTVTFEGVTMRVGDGSTVLLPGLPTAAWLTSDATIRDAIALGILDGGDETETILEMPCTVVVSAEPLDGGTWRPPTAESRTESCVSADGLILRDEWFLEDRSVRSRVVTARTGRTIEDALFEIDADPTPSGVTITRIDAPDGTFTVDLPAPPEGFAAGPLVLFDRAGISGAVAGHGERWLFTDGGDVVMLEQERAIDGEPVPSTGTPIRFAGHDATARASIIGLEISWIVDDVRVTVSGTTSLAILEAWAETFTAADA